MYVAEHYNQKLLLLLIYPVIFLVVNTFEIVSWSLAMQYPTTSILGNLQFGVTRQCCCNTNCFHDLYFCYNHENIHSIQHPAGVFITIMKVIHLKLLTADYRQHVLPYPVVSCRPLYYIAVLF